MLDIPRRLAARLGCILAAGFFGLAGCSMMGHVKTDGWPELKVTETKVDLPVIRERCSKYLSPLMGPALACAEFNLTAGTCQIWYAWDSHLEHERQHCLGYDHVGGTVMAEAVVKYREIQARAAMANLRAASQPRRPETAPEIRAANE